MARLSIVIPAKNEAGGIVPLLRALKAAKGLPRSRELIVVDDGSDDATGELAKKAGARVLRTTGLGYGGALKLGFSRAKGEYLCFLDADLTYPVENLELLWKERRAACMLLINRFGNDQGMPLMRRLGNRAFSLLMSLRLGRKVPDPCSGQRLFPRKLSGLAAGLPNGLEFSPALTLAALRQANAKWLNGTYLKREGNSKLSVIGDGLRFLKIVLLG